MKCVVLLSGGLDSAVTTAMALEEYDECTALTFKYGQRHGIEARKAEQLAEFYNIKEHHFIEIPSVIFNSALVSSSGRDVPKDGNTDSDVIPDTYVPARNILFLSYGVALAESIEASAVFIGAHALDYSGYPDCRPEFFSAYEEMVQRGTKAGVEGRGVSIRTPIIDMTKSEIIKKGMSLGVDFSLTHSCYDPDREGRPCGRCDSCIIRLRGFREAGIPDPLRYSGD